MYLTWYRRAQSYKHHSSDRVFEANGATEMRRQVTDDCCQKANDRDGDEKASPTIPVVSRGDEGKQKLPKDSEEVHNVVKTGGHLFLATFIIIIIT